MGKLSTMAKTTNDSRQNILHIDLLPFELEHIKQYIINKDIWNDENLIDYISSKVLTLTKGFPFKHKNHIRRD